MRSPGGESLDLAGSGAPRAGPDGEQVVLERVVLLQDAGGRALVAAQGKAGEAVGDQHVAGYGAGEVVGQPDAVAAGPVHRVVEDLGVVEFLEELRPDPVAQGRPRVRGIEFAYGVEYDVLGDDTGAAVGVDGGSVVERGHAAAEYVARYGLAVVAEDDARVAGFADVVEPYRQGLGRIYDNAGAMPGTAAGEAGDRTDTLESAAFDHGAAGARRVLDPGDAVVEDVAHGALGDERAGTVPTRTNTGAADVLDEAAPQGAGIVDAQAGSGEVLHGEILHSGAAEVGSLGAVSGLNHHGGGRGARGRIQVEPVGGGVVEPLAGAVEGLEGVVQIVAAADAGEPAKGGSPCERERAGAGICGDSAGLVNPGPFAPAHLGAGPVAGSGPGQGGESGIHNLVVGGARIGAQPTRIGGAGQGHAAAVDINLLDSGDAGRGHKHLRVLGPGCPACNDGASGEHRPGQGGGAVGAYGARAADG